MKMGNYKNLVAACLSEEEIAEIKKEAQLKAKMRNDLFKTLLRSCRAAKGYSTRNSLPGLKSRWFLAK